MRGIKFRAWGKEKKQMFEVVNIALKFDGVDDNPYHYISTMGGGFSWTEDRDKLILMQYIGLKDKNDKEIYEGDIGININNQDGYGNMIVKFGEHDTSTDYYKDTAHGFYLQSSKEILALSKYFCKNNYEIIGNIYENPELL